MSTISSREVIMEMLRNNGTYPGDPQVYSIWEYHNQFDGGICWKVCYQERDEKIFLSCGAFRGVPKAIWQRDCEGYVVPSKQ
jgi:hypothetical protein